MAAIVIAALVPFLLPLPANGSPNAQPAGPFGSQAACVAQWLDSVSPGMSLNPATGIFTSNGQTGTITCAGSVNATP